MSTLPSLDHLRSESGETLAKMDRRAVSTPISSITSCTESRRHCTCWIGEPQTWWHYVAIQAMLEWRPTNQVALCSTTGYVGMETPKTGGNMKHYWLCWNGDPQNRLNYAALLAMLEWRPPKQVAICSTTGHVGTETPKTGGIM